ncbi:E3 ubiquitin-protein ligase TRIM56-like isoform X2 [Mytilus galloprovincialis]|uniref:E3 ubiquitin-protein ligase TRIM56-like isoform X2 n=1 Tax=Mytilus galloprovincialis TaxID=29158 RepID=UPI003F7BD2E0
MYLKDGMELEQTELVIPQQYLCCPICEEEFKQPKFLPCLHTFCNPCISGHIDKNIDEDNYFPCPVCATEIKNEQDAAPLPENILARRLSKVSSSTNLKPQTLCWFCKNAGNFVDAVTFCDVCENALCPTCTESHKTSEETDNHSLISIDEYDARVESKQEEGFAKNSHVIPKCCELYDAMDIGAVFCIDCDLLICADCHVNNHGNHRCAELTTVAGHFESKIKDPLDELNDDEKELDEALLRLDKSEEVIQNQTKELHKVVKKRTKFLSDLITEYENMLIEEVNKRNTQKKDEIANRRYDIKMHLKSINGVKEFTENLLSYGSYEEKVFLRKKVGYRIRELCEETLGTDEVETLTIKLTKPNVTVETICNLFGELSEKGTDTTENRKDSNANIYHLNLENSHGSHGSDTAENTEPELEEIFNQAQETQYNSGSDSDMLSASNNSENFRNVKFSEEIEKTEYEAENCFELGEPKKETELPAVIQRECIKGIGINSKGDMIIGTTTTGSQMVYVLEKRGIVKGTVHVDNGWNIHSISSDGKVAMTIPRGDNRFKVRVLENDGTGHILSDSNIESFGLNFVTADNKGSIIVTSNRYAKLRSHHGKSAKSGGNIAFYSKDGLLTKRITNDDFHEFGLYLLEKPQCVAVDNKHNLLVVTDPGSNTVIAFNLKGELIFEYGNSDTEGEIYQGPDLISIDKYGNIIVTDKREGRIDILSSKGHLKKSFLLDDIPRFVGTLPDKLLVIVMPEGTMKYYEYL